MAIRWSANAAEWNMRPRRDHAEKPQGVDEGRSSKLENC